MKITGLDLAGCFLRRNRIHDPPHTMEGQASLDRGFIRADIATADKKGLRFTAVWHQFGTGRIRREDSLLFSLYFQWRPHGEPRLMSHWGNCLGSGALDVGIRLAPPLARRLPTQSGHSAMQHHRKTYGNFQNRASCAAGASPGASGTSPNKTHGRSHPGDSHLLVLHALTDASTMRKLFSTSRPDTVRP